MIGFACNETTEYMPLTISLAHLLCKRLAAVRKDGRSRISRLTASPGHRRVLLWPTVRVDTVVVSTQHTDDVELKTAPG